MLRTLGSVVALVGIGAALGLACGDDDSPANGGPPAGLDGGAPDGAELPDGNSPVGFPECPSGRFAIDVPLARADGGPGSVSERLGDIVGDVDGLYFATTTSIRSLSRCGVDMTTLATGVRAEVLRVNGTFVFFSTSEASGGKIRRLPRAGGGEPVDIVTIDGGILSFALGRTHIYFTTNGNVGNTLMRVPLQGGTAELLATDTDDWPRWHGVAVDGEFVYVADDGAPGEHNGTILKKPLEGGELTGIADQGVAPARNITLDDTYVYAVSQGSPVFRIPKAGASGVTRYGGVNNAGVIGQDGTSVYFSNTLSGHGVLKQVPIGGGQEGTSLVDDVIGIAGLAVVGKSVFWTQNASEAADAGYGTTIARLTP